MPDPHGNIAATETASTAIANAIRYDGYGQTLGTPYVATGAITLDTKYQGRLDLSPSPTFPVYEFSARNLAPTLGTFTSLDPYTGSAQDPASMNRFLYAQANPTTLIDPTGHDACVGAECDNPTYDDRSEGLDLCVKSCQDSTTEYGQGDAGYGSSKPPKPHTTTVAGASTPPVRDTWTAADENLLSRVAGVWVGPGGAPFTPEDQSRLYAACIYETVEEACAGYRAGLVRDNAIDAAFCAANGEACRLRSEQFALTLALTAELVLTAITLVDFVPGDEVIAGGATAATATRLGAISNDIATLGNRAMAATGAATRTPAQSRVLLGRNLVESMGPGATRPVNSAAHHIVELKRLGAGRARTVLARFNIDIDSADNGVFLDPKFHQTVPSRKAYTDAVDRLMANASNREEALATLQFIRNQLLSAQASGTMWP